MRWAFDLSEKFAKINPIHLRNLRSISTVLCPPPQSYRRHLHMNLFAGKNFCSLHSRHSVQVIYHSAGPLLCHCYGIGLDWWGPWWYHRRTCCQSLGGCWCRWWSVVGFPFFYLLTRPTSFWTKIRLRPRCQPSSSYNNSAGSNPL